MTDLETKRLETQAMLDNADLLFDQEQCRAALQKVADDITRDLANKYPLLLPVMGGAVVFTGQLLPLLRFPLDFDYVHVSRYGDKLAGGAFNWKRMPDPEQIKGRHVVVLDDILDEGHTMAAIQEKLLEMGAASCRAAVFANKLIDKRKTDQSRLCRLGRTQPLRLRLRHGCRRLLAQPRRNLRLKQ